MKEASLRVLCLQRTLFCKELVRQQYNSQRAELIFLIPRSFLLLAPKLPIIKSNHMILEEEH